MPYHWKWVGLILAYMAGVVHADPWDDFANNLFSDLAPLLALFGERATMQFMSQALGWEDCVILAMAPLGIITILVSAIRVGGPAWLKAVVGRARENMSAAEMELMSSTSKEVCELYNGQTIVRCQGSTPVWEFIYLTPIDPQNQAPKGKLDIKVLTLDEAGKEDRKLLRKLEDGPPERETPPSEDSPPSSTSKMATIFHRVFASPSSPSTRDVSIERGIRPETVPEQSPDEAIYVIRNMGSDAPNIILNLQNHNSNRRELRAFASVGVILQLCILVFFGIITYHPNVKNKFQKDDQRVDDYAFPLALSGTLVLALGIFLCGTVVESSTRETHYKRNDKYEMRIVWIQQKQTVGDQVFEAFATFPDAPRDVVTMSRRCDKAKARPLEPLTIIGISTGLAGFIIQFIGLRGMNSSQNERPGQGASGTGPEQGSVPVSSAKQRNTHSRAQQVFETRWNLSRLARFKGASAAEAVNLVTAMEKIMSVLFPLSSDDPEKAWAWPLAVAYGDSESAASECHVHISLIGKDRKWKVLADQLESVLSLCLFTAQKQEESRSKDSQAEFNLNDENDDWLRQKTIDSGLGIRLLGSTDAEKTDQLIQHLRWWAPEALDVLAEIQEVVKFHDEKDNNTEVSVERNSNTEVSVEDQSNQPQSSQKEEIDIEKETREELDQILKPDPKWDAIRVEDNRVVGYGAARPRSQSESTKQRLFQNFSVLKNAEREENRRGTLAIESNDSLEKLFAKDLLFSFLFSAAKTLPAALQTNVETRETTAGSSPNDTPRVLVTKEMTFLVAELSRLGFPDYFGITEVHSKAMDLKENGFGIRGKGVWNAVNERDICDWTPLHYAIISRNEAAIGALADERADPNLKNLKGYTPVHYLCQAGYDEYDWEWMDRWRLDARGLDGATPMHMAASSGNLKVIEEQIYREQHVLEEKAQPMERALKLRDFNGRLPIHWAVIHGHERVVEILKSTVEEPDIHGWTPLHLAALYHKSGSTMIETVFKLSADRERTDKTGCAPLVLACEKSKRQAVDELIKLGAEVNSETPNGEAALHYAIRQEDVKLVKILLDRGVKVSRTYNDPDSYTALHVAVKVGNGQVMETILDSLDSKTRSEYINFRDFAGRTPLHLAASLKRPEVMALLLSAGAYPNRRDPQGRTPLHSVFEESWRVDSREKESGRHILEMATILVENGADPEAQDASSETPLDLAEKNGFTDAADYLRGVPEARKSART
ncbi:hypothetical protein CEP54_013676 [Fusarium duplospermum]|uniref:Uncharacterized protein n=1 Tax=Fusarium duplospermum TaxID=1325734 RepID=A0A428P1B9_9HYPO|nr:hypothetical protein CEP54_013676 [Fusarium duplospermum]